MTSVRQISVSKYFGIASGHAVAQVFWMLTFAVLAAIGAQLEIPTQPVPFTLQTFFVLLAGAFLGKRNGSLSMAMYLAMGAVGLPVFSGGGFGVVRLVGPTGGYLLAFPIAAFVTGYLLHFRTVDPLRSNSASGVLRHYGRTLISMVVGLSIIFSLGTIQLNLVFFDDWNSAFNAGFLVFSWWDVLKLLAAAAIYEGVSRQGK